MIRRVAVIGKMHSGKSTLASMLVEKGYTRVAFADPLKEDIAAALNLLLLKYSLVDQLIDTETIAREKMLFRPIMQWLGTEFFRNYLQRPEHWVQQMRIRIERIEAGTALGMDDLPLVCDDVRFENEAQSLRSMGFSLIRINRRVEDRRFSIWKSLVEQGMSGDEAMKLIEIAFSHSTETLLDGIDVDFEFENTDLSSLGQFAENIMDGLDPLLTPRDLREFEKMLP